jgi:hypothetical protein
MYHLVPPMRFAFCTELWLVDKFHSIQPYSSIFIHGHDCTVMLPACKCYHMLSKFPEKYTWIYTILNPLYHQRDLKHFGRWSAKCIPLPIRGWGWSHPFSSGPGISLYKMPDLSLFFSLQNEYRKDVKTGFELCFFHQDCFQRLFLHVISPNL